MVQPSQAPLEKDMEPLGIHAQPPEVDQTLVARTEEILAGQVQVKKKDSPPDPSSNQNPDPLDHAGYHTISGR